MLSWLKFLPLIPRLLGFLTALFSTIHGVEGLFTSGQQGAAKKAAVLALLGQALGIAQAIGVPEAKGLDANTLEGIASTAIDALVAIANTTGLFKHSAPSAPAGP